MKKKKYIITSSLLAASLFAITPALAATVPPYGTSTLRYNLNFTKNGGGGAVGTVSAINGASITLAGKNGTIYIVDGSNAKITKAGSTITASAIVIGDTLVVRGTVSGTSIAATVVMDGVPHNTGTSQHAHVKGSFSIGTISSLNGSEFTITSKEHVRHAGTTTPATSSTTMFAVTTNDSTTFKKGGQPSALADLELGQYVMISGPKSTTTDSITATNVNILTGTTTNVSSGKRGKKKTSK